jgi:GDP-D-mannose dehydratase
MKYTEFIESLQQYIYNFDTFSIANAIRYVASEFRMLVNINAEDIVMAFVNVHNVTAFVTIVLKTLTIKMRIYRGENDNITQVDLWYERD